MIGRDIELIRKFTGYLTLHTLTNISLNSQDSSVALSWLLIILKKIILDLEESLGQ